MSQNIHDYLTKQLFIEKNVTTFRSLSRQFKIHVNAAKNELAKFHANPDPSAGSVHATYLLTGELTTSPSSNGDSMDVDMDTTHEEDDGEQVPSITVTLVGEQDLESVKSTYARIFSQHVYCLSPSPVIDAGLVCTPSEKVYETDAKLKQDEAALLGRAIGPHVQKGKPVKFSAVSAKEPLTRKPTEPLTSKTKESPKDDGKKDEKPVEQKKLKASGTLDWSKAKPKQTKAEEKEKAKREKPKVKEEVPKEESKPKVKPAPPTKSLKPAASKSALSSKPETKPDAKRGVKRKSALDLDSSDDEIPSPQTGPSSGPSSKPSSAAKSSPSPSPPPAAAPAQKKGAKLKRMVVVSDDEDDVPPRRPKAAPKAKAAGKAKKVVEDDMDVDALPSKKEMSLRAMMDIDDDDVIRASTRKKTPPPPPSSEPDTDVDTRDAPASPDGTKGQSDEDVEMADEGEEEDDYEASLAALAKPNAKPKRKARAPKKAVPLGRNGLPKRRKVVSQQIMHPNGYFETKDVSEYESVDEDDPDAQPAPPPPKSKKNIGGKGKKTVSPEGEKSAEVKDDTESDEAKEEKSEKSEKSEKAKVTKKGKEEEKKEPRKVIKPGQPIKRSGTSGGSKSGQGSLRDFFGKK